MNNLKINHGAVWVIVVLGQVVPSVWYVVFAEQWMSFNGFTEQDFENTSFTPYIVSLITSIFYGYMLAWVYKRMGVESLMDGLKTGLIIGFPISILNTMTLYMFSLRPYGLSWIDGGHGLVVFALAGIILGSWRKYESA